MCTFLEVVVGAGGDEREERPKMDNRSEYPWKESLGDWPNRLKALAGLLAYDNDIVECGGRGAVDVERLRW